MALLDAAEVRQVADVRAHPGSRRLPHFASGRLESALAERRAGYRHLPALGGRRRPRADSVNDGWQNASFRAYADHTASREFAEGLSELECLAAAELTAMMCAEGLWWRCHRRLVADALVARGWEVLHIAPDGRLSTHELTPFAELRDGRLTYPARPGQALLGT